MLRIPKSLCRSSAFLRSVLLALVKHPEQSKLTAGTSANTFDADEWCSQRQTCCRRPSEMLIAGRIMQINGRSLLIAALIIVLLCAHAASALAAQAKPLVKLVVGYGSTDGTIAVLGFAKETKLFEKHGLDVVLVGMGTGSVSLRALIAKELEIASLSGSGLVQAALQGADTVLIAALINGFVFKVFAAPEISSPAQLKGKKLGVSRYGATSDFAVRLALKKWGLNPDRDVNILQIGTSQDTIRAMQTKMLDAGIMSGASSLIARKAGFRELGDLADLGLHYPTSAIGTTKSYLQKNEGVVKEFMLAYIEAIHDFKRNKETALAVLKKYTRNDDREVLEDAYSNAASKYLPLPIPTIEGIRTILTELSTTVPAAKNADPEQFVSTKIAREIEASGFLKRLYKN
jgi:NitT/TauT family transport system substrate-binding protein